MHAFSYIKLPRAYATVVEVCAPEAMRPGNRFH